MANPPKLAKFLPALAPWQATGALRTWHTMAQGNIEAVVRPARAQDAEAVCTIYNPYITDTVITFEEAAVTAEDMRERMAQVGSAQLPWLVADSGGVVVGYAYAAAFRARSAYRFSVETTVYLQADHAGRGVGRALYGALIAALRQRDLHSAIGSIALPNEASVALHERLGFHKVAHLEQVGWKLERWVDVGYWQLRL